MKNVVLWLIGCILVTLFCGLVYVSVQQTLRLGANDPQIQIATDVRNSLESGDSINNLSYSVIDAGKSLSPFVIIYDNSGRLISKIQAADIQQSINLKGYKPGLYFIKIDQKSSRTYKLIKE